AVVCDFEKHLDLLPTGEYDQPLLMAVLGSTIGNQDPRQRALFLREISTNLHVADGLLLGVDLVNDHVRLVATYDDAQGITAIFNRNVLSVINRELDADFDTMSFDHLAIWITDEEWIKMRLRARENVHVH